MNIYIHCIVIIHCIHICCFHYIIGDGTMATSIRLEPSLEKRLNDLAAQTGRTKAYYLRELIARGLDALETKYLAAAMSERSGRIEERTYTAEQLRKNLGLDR